jgi:hypothetical protein
MDRAGDFGHGVCDLLHGVIIVVREEPEACGLPLDSALPVFEPARRVGTFPRPLRTDKEFVRAVSYPGHADSGMNLICVIAI